MIDIEIIDDFINYLVRVGILQEQDLNRPLEEKVKIIEKITRDRELKIKLEEIIQDNLAGLKKVNKPLIKKRIDRSLLTKL